MLDTAVEACARACVFVITLYARHCHLGQAYWGCARHTKRYVVLCVEHAAHARKLVMGRVGQTLGPILPKRIGPGVGSGALGPVQNTFNAHRPPPIWCRGTGGATSGTGPPQHCSPYLPTTRLRLSWLMLAIDECITVFDPYSWYAVGTGCLDPVRLWFPW
jgi:hypothetical protein